MLPTAIQYKQSPYVAGFKTSATRFNHAAVPLFASTAALATDTADLGDKKAPEAPPPKPSWAITRFFSGIGRFTLKVLSNLWPLNWPLFNRKAKPAEAPAEASAPASDAAVPTRTAQAAADAGAIPSVTEEPPVDLLKEVPQPKKGIGFRAAMAFGFRMMLNGFHLGAALFILAGAPLIHGPMWVGIASVLGVQMLQSWVSHRYKNADITDPAKMKEFTRKLTLTYYDKLRKGRRFLQKIPLIRRLDGLYMKLGRKVGKIMQKGIDFFTQKLLYNTVSMSQLPDDFWKKSLVWKAGFIAKTLIYSSIGLVCKPLGPVGKYIMRYLDVQGATAWVDAFAPRNLNRTPPSEAGLPATPAPEGVPPSSPHTEASGGSAIPPTEPLPTPKP